MNKYLASLAIFISAFAYPASISITLADSSTVSSVNGTPVVTIGDASLHTKKVWVTAYSSTPEETDDTPFITASGERVRDGIVATNFLPFGTKITIPAIFGNKVFIVKDRMHRRMKNFVDVWMDAKIKAVRFGIHRAEIVILDEGPIAMAKN